LAHRYVNDKKLEVLMHENDVLDITVVHFSLLSYIAAAMDFK